MRRLHFPRATMPISACGDWLRCTRKFEMPRFAFLHSIHVSVAQSFLFHRYTLGKIPWAVNVFAFADSDVVGQQLEGYAGDERLEALKGVG